MFHNAIILSPKILGHFSTDLYATLPVFLFVQLLFSSLQTQILGHVVLHVNLSEASGRNDSQSPRI